MADSLIYEFHGDSITFGIGASALQNRWTTLFSTAIGITEINKGVSGMAMQDSLAVCEGRTIFNPEEVSNYTNEYGYLFIALGVGDIGSNTPFSTVTNFKNNYLTKLEYVLTVKFWPPNKVVLVTPTWFEVGFYKSVPGLPGCTVSQAPNRERAESFVMAVLQVAIEKGCQYIDVYTPMKNYINPASLLFDEIHPNNEGYDFLSNLFINKNYTMANNIAIGPNARVAKTTTLFSAIPAISQTSISQIFEVEGGYKS